MRDIKNGMRPRAGEMLRDETVGAGLTDEALSTTLDVLLDRLTTFLDGREGLAAHTTLRLGRYFATTPELWHDLQQTWELHRAEIARQVVPRQSPAWLA